jgi:cytoskeletal protein CcmA (bactofilin family)
LYIDGKVEGAITLPDSRVTVSRNKQVSANITAREVVVFSKVSGNIMPAIVWTSGVKVQPAM